MIKRRLIPILFLKDGWMVRSENFKYHQYIGDPILHVQRMMQWNVDELIVIDIGFNQRNFKHNRSDYKSKPVENLEDFISLMAIECGLPLSYGGGIKSLNDAILRIRYGADKVVLNQALFSNPKLVHDCVKSLGSQAVVASIDYRIKNKKRMVYIKQGTEPINIELEVWVKEVCKLNVGEILINAIDRDGTAIGYDIETINIISNITSVPLIACGGAGHQSHFLKVFKETKTNAIAAGNIFHFKENAYPIAKNFLKRTLDDIR